MKNRMSLCMIALVLLLPLSGCGGGETKPKDRKVVARINRYELTADDFRDEANLIRANKYFSGNPDKVKDDLLDEMIDKKVLLQEAQARNIDKDASFMKEIERYWEQALLKTLIREKMKELSRSITVNLSEVREEYDLMAKEEPDIAPFNDRAQEIKDDIYKRKMQDALDAWIHGLRMKSDIEIYKENL